MNHNVTQVPIADFINKELILFSMADNIRSIPSVVDGFKPGQRKVLFACFKRKLKVEIKVSHYLRLTRIYRLKSTWSLSLFHSGRTTFGIRFWTFRIPSRWCFSPRYDHRSRSRFRWKQQRERFGSEWSIRNSSPGSLSLSLCATQSNHWYYLLREQGGKDAASARYIFTNVAAITRTLFHPSDDDILDYLNDDGQSIEPTWWVVLSISARFVFAHRSFIGTFLFFQWFSSTVPTVSELDGALSFPTTTLVTSSTTWRGR